VQLKELKGIGEKTSELLNKLSIFSVEDLVEFFPRDYDVYENPVFVKDMNDYLDKPAVAIDAVVVNTPDIK